MTTKEVETVNKPWGWERWLELNDKYCFKMLHLKAGQRTSFQFHKRKIETMYFLEGSGTALLENDRGEMEERSIGPGDYFTLHPPKKHRITAITDLTYVEASTPEMEDVIRIEDDLGRASGRIDSEHKKYE